MTRALLYTTAVSANGRKCLALVQHLDLAVEVHTINVYAGEGGSEHYRKINPWGKVPTLVDGDFVLWESNAILVYLSETLGGFRLSSNNPQHRAEIFRWMFWEAAHWQPTLSRVLAPRAAQLLFPKAGAAPVEVNWGDRELRDLLSGLDNHLTQRSFVGGNELSIADLSIAGMTTYFGVAAFPRSAYPSFTAWLDRIERLPAWVDTRSAPWAPAE